MVDKINFTSYIPTTLFGLLGLLFVYLYLYFKNRDNNKLAKIKAIKLNQRSKVVQMELNELGVMFDTSKLTNEQQFALLKEMLISKTRKFLIIAISAILIAIMISFLIFSEGRFSVDPKVDPKPIVSDSTNTSSTEDSTNQLKNKTKTEDIETSKVQVQKRIDPDKTKAEKTSDFNQPSQKEPKIKELYPENIAENISGFYKIYFSILDNDGKYVIIDDSNAGGLTITSVSQNKIKIEGNGNFTFYNIVGGGQGGGLSSFSKRLNIGQITVEIPAEEMILNSNKNEITIPISGIMKVYNREITEAIIIDFKRLLYSHINQSNQFEPDLDYQKVKFYFKK